MAYYVSVSLQLPLPKSVLLGDIEFKKKKKKAAT